MHNKTTQKYSSPKIITYLNHKTQKIHCFEHQQNITLAWSHKYAKSQRFENR
jgi:hypothetical protein